MRKGSGFLRKKGGLSWRAAGTLVYHAAVTRLLHVSCLTLQSINCDLVQQLNLCSTVICQYPNLVQQPISYLPVKSCCLLSDWGCRVNWHRCWHTFAAWSAVDSVDLLPLESLFSVHSTWDVLYHHCQFLKRCLPSGVISVPYILEGQNESSCLTTQYLT